MKGMKEQGIACRLKLVLICLPLLCTSAESRAEEARTEEVTVAGESEVSYDAALDNALRAAVRQVAGVVLDSATKTADFELVRDMIYSKAAGYVRKHDVLEKRRGLDGTYIVRIHAEVARGSISGDYLAILNLIEHLGRPRFIVKMDGVKIEGENPDVAEMQAWIEGSINEELRKHGLSVLHGQAYIDSLDRQYRRAVAAGDSRRAIQLKLMMAAPYEVRVFASGRTWRESIHGVPGNFASVELRATTAHADSAEIVGTKSGDGTGGSTTASGLRRACEVAVAAVLPQVLDEVFRDWTKYLDVGRPVTVQVSGAPAQVSIDLANTIRTSGLSEIKRVALVQAPEFGVAELRVIARLSAEDIARQVPTWTGGLCKASTEGEYLVIAQLAKPVEPVPVEPGATTAQTPSTLGTGSSATPRPDYLLPAIILGVFLLLAVAVAAIILRKR